MPSWSYGWEGKLYYGTAGAQASTELTNAKDVTVNGEGADADVTTKACGGFKLTAMGLIDASIDFDMVWDITDAAFSTLQNAWLNRTPIAFAALLDGHGLDADCAVMKFSKNEPVGDVITASVSVKPTRSSRAPQVI